MVEINTTKPVIEIKPDPVHVPPRLQQLKFGLSIKALTERNAQGEIINTIPLEQEMNFINLSPLFNGTNNTIWSYSSELPNKATLNVTVSFYYYIFIPLKLLFKNTL